MSEPDCVTGSWGIGHSITRDGESYEVHISAPNFSPPWPEGKLLDLPEIGLTLVAKAGRWEINAAKLAQVPDAA